MLQTAWGLSLSDTIHTDRQHGKAVLVVSFCSAFAVKSGGLAHCTRQP